MKTRKLKNELIFKIKPKNQLLDQLPRFLVTLRTHKICFKLPVRKTANNVQMKGNHSNTGFFTPTRDRNSSTGSKWSITFYKLEGEEGNLGFYIQWKHLLNEKENKICKSLTQCTALSPLENTLGTIYFCKERHGSRTKHYNKGKHRALVASENSHLEPKFP